MKIVAIGGGEIGRLIDENDESKGRYPIETFKIDKEVVILTGKKNPRLLFLPTATSDSLKYCEVVERYYGKKLGCKVDYLLLTKKDYSPEEIRRRIFGSDVIYVGGGNTRMMLEVWKAKGVDKMLKEAAERNIVLAGVSAGAICWFDSANSDSERLDKNNPAAKLIKLNGLGLVNLMACPHYDGESRRASLHSMVQEHGERAIALDNCAAMEIVDDKYRILSTRQGASGHLVYLRNGVVFEDDVEASRKFSPLVKLRKA